MSDPPSRRRELRCWFDFEDGHTCLLKDDHEGPHQPTPDDEIIISFGPVEEDAE